MVRSYMFRRSDAQRLRCHCARRTATLRPAIGIPGGDVPTGIGVDGCKDGWFYFELNGERSSFGHIQSAAELKHLAPAGCCVLIDIPIGLPESQRDTRACDERARKVLKTPRRSSVFSAPCRQALRANSYEEALRINREVLGLGLSRQSWGIAPKIREVDELLRGTWARTTLPREAHPEVCFWGLYGSAMRHPKKRRDGFHERMQVLNIFEPLAEQLIASAFLTHGGFDASRDDIVDAFVLALCARSDAKRTLPEAPARDKRGLSMEMVYVSGRDLLTQP